MTESQISVDLHVFRNSQIVHSLDIARMEDHSSDHSWGSAHGTNAVIQNVPGVHDDSRDPRDLRLGEARSTLTNTTAWCLDKVLFSAGI